MWTDLIPALGAGLTAVFITLASRVWVVPELRHWLGNDAQPPHGALPHAMLAAGAAVLAAALMPAQERLLMWVSVGVWSGLLACCALTDLRFRLLPDRLTLALGLAGLGLALAGHGPGLWSSLAGGAFGYGLPWLVGRLMRKSTGIANGAPTEPSAPAEPIGRGDLALLGAMGLWVGFSGLPLVLVGASLVMLPIAAWGMLRRGWTRTTALPFGPALCLAGVFVLPWILSEGSLP